MQKELSGTHFFVTKCGMLHVSDTHLLHPGFSTTINIDEGLVDPWRSLAHGSCLTSNQAQAGFKTLAEFIVELGTPIGGDDFLTTWHRCRFFLWLGHFRA